jgi:hypothetical protein
VASQKEQMTVKLSMVAAGLAASAVVVGVAATGCGNDKPSTPSSTTSSSAASTSTTPSSTSAAPAPAPTSGGAQPTDYSNLLIKPSDIVVPGDTFTLTKTTSDPSTPGVGGQFDNQNGTRKINVAITVYPDAAAAAKDNDSNGKNLDMFVKGPPATPADVGTGGALAVGPSPDGSKSAAVVVFAEGKTNVLITFESAPNDPLQPDFVLDIGRKQDAAIKAGLPA